VEPSQRDDPAGCRPVVVTPPSPDSHRCRRPTRDDLDDPLDRAGVGAGVTPRSSPPVGSSSSVLHSVVTRGRGDPWAG
jgi:hypothetical protein